MQILVTGAGGFVGQRLVAALVARGHQVRAMSRDPNKLRFHPWAEDVELVAGDLDRPDTLGPALQGVEVAYYLVHGMEDNRAFSEVDKSRAEAFARAGSGLKQVIYLGGLVPKGDTSEHLMSREEVGAILRARLPTTEFRSGPILGPGSASFEIARYLGERLPIIPIPPWGKHALSTISVEDMVAYLIAALDAPPLGALDVGSDETSFVGLLSAITQARGLKRRHIPFPALPLELVTLAISILTPVSPSVAAALIEGVHTPLVADTTLAKRHFPGITPMSLGASVERALQGIDTLPPALRWTPTPENKGHSHHIEDKDGLIRDTESLFVDATPDAAFKAIAQVGGLGVTGRGWPSVQWAWRLRGALDGLTGGPGGRIGRPTRALRVGDQVDFWVVEAIEAGRLLRLKAQMALPGTAWLQLEVIPEGAGCRVVQSSIFAPKGVRGLAYWWALYPAHRVVFGAMLQGFVDWIQHPTSAYQHLHHEDTHETHPREARARAGVGLGLPPSPQVRARA